MKFNSSRALSATATMPSRERDAKNQLFIAPGTNNCHCCPPALPPTSSAQVFRRAPMISPTRGARVGKKFLPTCPSLSHSLYLFLCLSLGNIILHVIFLYSHLWWNKKTGGDFPPFFSRSSLRKEEGYTR